MTSLLRAIIPVVVLSVAPLHVGAAEPAARVVAFEASVRVDVDATGKPAKVEAPADLPDAIRTYIERRVATWQYEPAKQNGVAVAATTYVSVNACAVPAEGGYSLGLDFDGNGPRRAGDQAFLPLQYPLEAMRSGTRAEFVVILDIGPDGVVSIANVEKSEFQGRSGRSAFMPVIERWANKIRFDPELVAGKPVQGKVRMPIEFILSDGRRNLPALAKDFQTKARASRECQLASGVNDTKPVAINSVVKVTPSPAS